MTQRKGANCTTATKKGATISAARSVCWTAHIFGANSAKIKMTTISNAVATTTPNAPTTSLATTPMMVAATSVQI